jgi:hypothetical protein
MVLSRIASGSKLLEKRPTTSHTNIAHISPSFMSHYLTRCCEPPSSSAVMHGRGSNAPDLSDVGHAVSYA